MKRTLAGNKIGRTKTWMIAGALLAGVFVLPWLSRIGQRAAGTILATHASAGDMTNTIAPPLARRLVVNGNHDEPLAESTEETTATASALVFQDNPLASLAEALRVKQAELDRKEKEIAGAEARLEALRREIDDSLKRIEAVRDEMGKLAGEAATKRREGLAKWIKIYQTMKPDETAQVLAGLERDFALELLIGMDPRKSSKVLGAMVQLDKEKALDLGKRLQEQNQ